MLLKDERIYLVIPRAISCDQLCLEQKHAPRLEFHNLNQIQVSTYGCTAFSSNF
jgi:hypothetical protein